MKIGRRQGGVIAVAVLAMAACILATAPVVTDDADGEAIGSPLERLTDGTALHGGSYYVYGDVRLKDGGTDFAEYTVYLTPGSRLEVPGPISGLWNVHHATDGGDGIAPTSCVPGLSAVSTGGFWVKASTDGTYLEGGNVTMSAGIEVGFPGSEARWYPADADIGTVDLSGGGYANIYRGSCTVKAGGCAVRFSGISDGPIEVGIPSADGGNGIGLEVKGGSEPVDPFYDIVSATSGKIEVLEGRCAIGPLLTGLASAAVYESDGVSIWASFDSAVAAGAASVVLRGTATVDGKTVPEGMTVTAPDDLECKDITVNGKLSVSGKLRADQIKGTGTVSADGGTEAGNLVVDGGMAFESDLKCKALTILSGTLTVGGSLESGDATVSKGASLSVAGDAATGTLSVLGSAHVKGDLSTGDLTIEGILHADGDVSSENVAVNGMMTVMGTLSSKNLTTGEKVRVVQEGRIYVLDINGKLDVYKDLIYERTRARGDVSVEGRHRYGDVAVRQSFAVEGEVSAMEFAVEDGGIATVGGSMAADSLSVSEGGSLTVEGGLSCTEAETLGAEPEHMLDVMGALDVGSDLSFDRAVVGGALSVSGDLSIGSIRVIGSLDVGGTARAETFVVEEGHDVSGDINAGTMIVPAGVTFVSGWNLDAVYMVVLGTFIADLPFSAETICVGMALTSDEPSAGSSAVLDVPEGYVVTGLKALYVAEGAAVYGLTDSMASTSYIVDGIAYATGYAPSGTSLKVSGLRVPASNGTATSGWTHTVDGKEVAVGDMLVGIADEVHASLCKVSVLAGEGFDKVFIDKAEVPVGGGSVSLSTGAHTVRWTLMDGYAGGGVAVTFAGNAVSGGSFTVGDEDGAAVLELTGAEPAGDDNGSSWSTYAAVLVVIVILAVALVGYKAMRP